MNISIDDQTADFLLLTLKGNTWWPAVKVTDAINKEKVEQKIRAECKHEPGEYIGKKNCCVICGGLSEWEGESWTLKK